MTSGVFDTGDWIERVVAALCPLAKAQDTYLHAYWQYHPREQLIVDGRDETPFPLDDLRMVYAEARYSQTFGREASMSPFVPYSIPRATPCCRIPSSSAWRYRAGSSERMISRWRW